MDKKEKKELVDRSHEALFKSMEEQIEIGKKALIENKKNVEIAQNHIDEHKNRLAYWKEKLK